jgi:two-component system phosphate regulon response regulator PhoB
MITILLVARDDDLAVQVATTLVSEGYQVRRAGHHDAALVSLPDVTPDLVILDLDLPGASGFDLLSEIRSAGHAMPIIVVSVRTETGDAIRCFRLGADDYVRKPFEISELVERVRARLRGPAGHPHVIRTGALVLNPEARTVRVGEDHLHLPPKEFDLLHALLVAPDRVHSRRALLARVWSTSADVKTRTVDFHIAQLREKLSPFGLDRHIVTARRHGFAWTSEPAR